MGPSEGGATTPRGITSWMDRPLPSASKAPSSWLAAVAPPHRKLSGNASVERVVLCDMVFASQISTMSTGLFCATAPPAASDDGTTALIRAELVTTTTVVGS